MIMKNYIHKRYSLEETPLVSKSWAEKKNDKRVLEIKKILSQYSKFKEYEVINTLDDGQVIFKIYKSIPASIRGTELLELEEILKIQIDKGLTIWLEPVGDKSKLRNLRGIKFE